MKRVATKISMIILIVGAACLALSLLSTVLIIPGALVLLLAELPLGFKNPYIIFNVIPLIVLGIFIVGRVKLWKRDSGLYYEHIGSVVGSIIGVLTIIVLCDLAFFLDSTSDSPSSTGSLIFLALPGYAFLFMLLGHLSGQWIGKYISKKKQERESGDGITINRGDRGC